MTQGEIEEDTSRLTAQKEGSGLIRMSMLRNAPVVFGQRHIGLVQDVCFDQTRKKVSGFVVTCGMRGKKMVPAQRIRLVSERFILIDGLEKYRHSDKQETALFIRDTTGILVGCVSDYAIDKKTLDVLALEMMLGYGPKENRIRIWTYAYTFSQQSGELSIPLDLRAKPYVLREENNACEYPP